jgi:hypothetical protein
VLRSIYSGKTFTPEELIEAAARLAALQREWPTQVPAEPDPERFDDLVSRGEAVLSTELGGWVQQMNEALRELQARQAGAARQVDPGLPTPPPLPGSGKGSDRD